MQSLFLIYGKIIVDNIRLRSGELTPGHLGGGGPQAAFGARLWHSPIALLTRSGTDLEPEHEQFLRSLDLDLSGWQHFDDLPTPRGLMEYDENEQLSGNGLNTSREDWFRLLDRPVLISPAHRQAVGIHLITEFGDERIVETALELQRNGMLLSVEPIFHVNSCPDPSALLNLCRKADLVTPDWPSATALSGLTDPLAVLRFWSNGPAAVAIRRGAIGSYVWQRDGNQAWHVPPLPVDVVDPTGAGNAYGGGWFIGWHASHDARIAGCYGTVAAALMIGSPGMPRLTDSARQRAAELLDLALARTTPLTD